MRRLAFLFVTATAMAGCAGTYETSGTVDPDLVDVSPGVQVVADYDEPVFFTNGGYYRYYGGRWYNSRYYNRGWVTVSTPPSQITRIERPYAYRHYRPNGYVARRDRGRGPVIRDHRH
jgi:hypothetical protein